jgi:tetratricopeptide (TPR) repeat protein
MTAQTRIADRTAEVIRSAVAAAQAGRIAEACAIGEQGLADGCEPAPLHAMVGSFLCAERSFDAAVPHLQVACEDRPADPVIARNLAAALIELGRFDEVTDVPEQAIAADRTGGLLRLRGYAAQMAGDDALAIAAYERLLQAFPNDWEAWNNLGNARMGAGDVPGAIAAFDRSARLNPGAAQTRLNLAGALRQAGELADAERHLRALAEDFPNDPTPLAHLYGLLYENGFDAEAEEALKGALERDPDNVGMLIALGRLYLSRFAMAEGEAKLRRVLELDPANGSAYLSLADARERERPRALRDLLAEAEAAKVDEVRLNLIRALIAQREKRFEDGVDALKHVPDDFDPVRRWHLQGQLLDGASAYDAAFAAFTRMNEALAKEPTQPLRRAAELRERLRGQLQRTTPKWRDSWAAPPLPAERPAPVFLLGFPRSGTTLLDTILMGHPDVEVMEELPVLFRLRGETGGFDSISRMDEAEVRRLQDRYFALAGEYAELRDGSLLVDKSPLHMQNLAQIYRLFPDARVILALRHPADVVLSCFMAKFRMNTSMANFVQLDTIAEFYDLSFALWEQSLSLFPMTVHTIVYEQMIEDQEGVIRPIIEALGLAWDAAMLDHQRTAEARGLITTASYAQVTQPLYRGAIGRWQHYRKHLEPVLPVLAPWAEKFGFSL